MPQAQWHHVAGKENPADCVSRGVSPQELLASDLWMAGPILLRSVKAHWTSVEDFSYRDDCPDRRGPSCLITTLQPTESDVLTNFSNLYRLLRATTHAREFIARIRRSTLNESVVLRPGDFPTSTPAQLDVTLIFWVNQIQRSFFQNEIQLVSQEKPVLTKSKLIRLNPFLDEQGLLRVGGRLRHSLLHPDQIHPIILPHGSHLSKQISVIILC